MSKFLPFMRITVEKSVEKVEKGFNKGFVKLKAVENFRESVDIFLLDKKENSM